MKKILLSSVAVLALSSAALAETTAVNPPVITPGIDIVSTGNTINSSVANANYAIALSNGRSVVQFSIVGLTASGATLTFQTSVDNGTTWVNHTASSINNTSNAATMDGQYGVNVAGNTNVRAIITSTGSGTITIASDASAAQGVTFVQNPLSNPTNSQIIQSGAVVSSGNPFPVSMPSGVTASQGAQAAIAAGNTWFFQQYLAGSAVGLTNPVPVTPGTGSVFPISASSLPLPAGAATSANQTVVQSASGTPQTTALTVQGNASGVALPVSAASLPLPTGASTATNQTNVQSAPGTPQTTALTIQGNTSGLAVPVSAASLPLPTGASTATNQTNVQSPPGTPQTTALTVQGNVSGVALPVSASALPLPTGASTAINQTNVQSAPGTPQTTALTVQGNASGVAVPISATSLPLPSGAATSGNQINVQSPPGTPQTTALTVQGNVGGVAVPISASALPLPSGAATATNQTNVQSAPGTPQTTALTIQGNASGVSVPITGALPSPDVTSTGNTINSATLNATYSIALLNARAHTKFSIVGLTASGATLTVEQSVDGGTTWVASPSSSSAGISVTITADGVYSVDTAASTNVRLRVSVVGTGTITVASDASSAPGITFISNSMTNPVNTQIIQAGTAVGSSAGLYARPQGFTSTSFSGTAPNGSFASVLAASSTRNGCMIQNTDTKIEYVYFGTNAAGTTANSIQLAAGQTISCTSGQIVLTDNVSIRGTSASATYVGFSQ